MSGFLRAVFGTAIAGMLLAACGVTEPALIDRSATTLSRNFGDMPPIEGLDPTDIAAITAFVRSVQEAEGLDPYPPP